jgi:heme O synthase-like polyprenyltransferase
MYGAQAIEHGTSRGGRWLRQRRMWITLWIAALEGLLYLFGALNWWAAVALAIIAVGFWWYAGRSSRSDTLRQASWIFAASQLLVLCVPLALGIVKAVAIGVIALIAIVALFFLFRERT